MTNRTGSNAAMSAVRWIWKNLFKPIHEETHTGCGANLITQKVEYEKLPDYHSKYRHLGHNILQ